MERPQKITFGEMRSTGVRGVLVYCADYRCSHSIAISAEQWPDDVRLSDIEPRFVCKACGKRGADVRPDFHWSGAPAPAMGYRIVKWGRFDSQEVSYAQTPAEIGQEEIRRHVQDGCSAAQERHV